MTNRLSWLGTLGLVAAILTSLAVAASGVVNVGGNISSNSSTSSSANSQGGGSLLNTSVSVSSNGNTSVGIIAGIEGSMTSGWHIVTSFFSNIWVSIQADLHI